MKVERQPAEKNNLRMHASNLREPEENVIRGQQFCRGGILMAKPQTPAVQRTEHHLPKSQGIHRHKVEAEKAETGSTGTGGKCWKKWTEQREKSGEFGCLER